MNTIRNVALFLLICLAGVWVAAQKDKQKRVEKSEVGSEVAETEPEYVPFPPSSPQPAAVHELPQPSTPANWYTRRRVSLVTDSGIVAIAAGSVVSLTEEGGQTFALHQGRKVPVTMGDLTNDPMEAERLRASAVASAGAGSVAAVEPTRVAPGPGGSEMTREQREKERAENKALKVARARQRNVALQALNQKISAIDRQISHEMAGLSEARQRGRVSSRNLTIDRLRKEMDELLERRRQILSAQN